MKLRALVHASLLSGLMLLGCPTTLFAYSQPYYQPYYQSYYEPYYQPYYQSYYQGTYTLKITKPVAVTGDANIAGTVTKQSGTFVIDHPLDPKNKLLFHSFVESPDVKNLYDGIATLDANGKAVVLLPEYFLALNKDFRYLGTPVGAPMPHLHLSGEVRRYFWIFGQIVLQIEGGVAGGKVSWQVTGTRRDLFIEQNPIAVEVDKGPAGLVDKDTYLCPECYGIKQ